jgi:cobalt-zinc-cadmium efflux system membrane fusion protein
MTSKSLLIATGCVAASVFMVACDKKFNPADGAPPPAEAVQTGDMSFVTVDKPDRFPVISADQLEAAGELKVTGTVNPDIAREVPVISLASGRVVDIKPGLATTLKKAICSSRSRVRISPTPTTRI